MICANNNIDTSIEMKLAKMMTRVYLMGVLLSLAHLHLFRTMKCGLHTQGQVSDRTTQDEVHDRTGWRGILSAAATSQLSVKRMERRRMKDQRAEVGTNASE